MELLDYSNYYYRTRLKEALPPQRSGKFVLISEERGTTYVVLSPKGFSSYHADIVRLFCEQKGIDGLYDGEHKHFAIFDTNWRVDGGGKWSIDEALKTLRLFGYSQAYGRFQQDGLAEELSAIDAVSGYAITIESD